MYYVGFCRVCENGLLGVRICPAGSVLVACDECESIWRTPDVTGPALSPTKNGSLCPCCQQLFWPAPAHWASWSEIRDKGWIDQVVGCAGPR